MLGSVRKHTGRKGVPHQDHKGTADQQSRRLEWRLEAERAATAPQILQQSARLCRLASGANLLKTACCKGHTMFTNRT